MTMKSSSKLLLFPCLVLFFPHFLNLTAAAPINLIYHLCVVENGNFTAKSTYETNRNQVLTSLYTNISIDYGFYTSTYGEVPNYVYAMAQCRPDMDAASCRNCIRNATEELTTICSNTKEAIGGYEEKNNYCMLRYANRGIFNLMEKAPIFFVDSDKNITNNLSEFKLGRKKLLDRLSGPAAEGDSHNKSASGEETASDMTIYAYVQCTPDITKDECDDCLQNATERLSECCDNYSGGRVIYPSCNFRYEISPILTGKYALSPTTDTMTNPETPPAPGKRKLRDIIIIVSVSVATLAILIICIFIYLRTRKLKDKFERNEDGSRKENIINDQDGSRSRRENIVNEDSSNFSHLDFGIIRVATDNFSDNKILGKGGFGPVYKGTLPDGQEIAVKRLARNSQQGELEFQTEVKLMTRLRHRNLVRLIGFSTEIEERVLIYEFLPNLSLDNYIFDPRKRYLLDWTKRQQIIYGIARGLLYLHEDSQLKIIHRDLKPGNILLDEKMNAKITDFGTARLLAYDQTQDNTNRISGTHGYMAPEYFRLGQISVKSDVFSFGVLALEIVSGQRNRHIENETLLGNLVTKAWRSWNERNTQSLIDPILGSGPQSEIMKCIHIALLCVQESAADRPSMGSVVQMLGNDSVPVADPLKPAYFIATSVTSQFSQSSSSNHSEESVKLIQEDALIT